MPNKSDKDISAFPIYFYLSIDKTGTKCKIVRDVEKGRYTKVS